MALSFMEILRKKRDGLELSTEEIKLFVQETTQRKTIDTQIAAMLMAIYIQKLSPRESVDLTKFMTASGSILKFPNHGKEVLVDKHSTGGVGDKISLVLAPALAACGLFVPMISGRSLGHTGGTLDKLESIPGFQVDLSAEKMEECLNRAGCFICGANKDIAPADAILYGIRDVTNTVDYEPLMVSSILSKKAAEGIGALVIDVKCGSAAFIKTEKKARELANMMVSVGSGLKLNVRTVISPMNTPLGRYVGNSLEVVESIKCLRNEVENSVTDLVKTLGGVLLHTKGLAKSLEEGKTTIMKTLQNKTALNKFRSMIIAQGVSPKNAEDLCNGNYWQVLPKANYTTVLKSIAGGFVTHVDALKIATACWYLREQGDRGDQVNRKIDYSAGVILLKVIGDTIKEGEPWIEIHHSMETLKPDVENLVKDSLVVAPNPPKPDPEMIVI